MKVLPIQSTLVYAKWRLYCTDDTVRYKNLYKNQAKRRSQFLITAVVSFYKAVLSDCFLGEGTNSPFKYNTSSLPPSLLKYLNLYSVMLLDIREEEVEARVL